MKEYSDYQVTPENANEKGTKRWLTALRANRGDEQLKIQNRFTEVDYHRVIIAIKNLYMQAQMEVTVFERDHKFDRSDGLYVMYSFITPHFSWTLECELTYNYKIEYDFRGFPFENELKALLRPFPLDRTAHHKPRQPSFTAFYKRVMAVQDKKYQYVLK